MSTVLFACVHNAGRSQMAAAWFNKLADTSKAWAASAGTIPASQVHPEVLQVMREVGVDLSNARPRSSSRQNSQRGQAGSSRWGAARRAQFYRACGVRIGPSRTRKANRSSACARFETRFEHVSRPLSRRRAGNWWSSPTAPDSGARRIPASIGHRDRLSFEPPPLPLISRYAMYPSSSSRRARPSRRPSRALRT